jgi:hypothetical protein
LTEHQLISLVAGDDWQINATFLDADDTPLDLTNAVILWTMLDASGHTAIAPGQFSVVPGTGPGQCTLTVPSTSSTTIAGGTYTNYWRLVMGGVTNTVLSGALAVRADPWGVAAAPAELRTKPVISIVNVRARAA